MGDLYISVVVNEYTCIWYVSLYARFCKYTTNMLIIYILHFHANVHTLLIFNRLYGCMLHVRAQLLYNVRPCVIFCISIELVVKIFEN